MPALRGVTDGQFQGPGKPLDALVHVLQVTQHPPGRVDVHGTRPAGTGSEPGGDPAAALEPGGMAGLVRGVIEFRAAVRTQASRSRATAGIALSLTGSGAAVAYVIFVVAHPYDGVL